MCMSKQCYTDFIDAKVLNRVILQECAKVLSHPLISLNFARKIGKQVQQFTETCKDIWEYSIYMLCQGDLLTEALWRPVQ